MKVTLIDQVGIGIAERLSAALDETDSKGFARNDEFHQGVKDGLRIALQVMQDLGCSTASYTYLASRPEATRVFHTPKLDTDRRCECGAAWDRETGGFTCAK